MLVKYLRHYDTAGQLKPWACVVAIGRGRIGYSICHENDKFRKDLARTIASGRACYYEHNGVSRRASSNPEVVLGKMLTSGARIIDERGQIVMEAEALAHAMDDIYERSLKYWPEKTALQEVLEAVGVE